MTLAPNERSFLLHRLESGIEGLLGAIEDCESNLRTFVHGTKSMFNHNNIRELNEESDSQINGRLRRLEKATDIAVRLVAARKTLVMILNSNESFTPNSPDDYDNPNATTNPLTTLTTDLTTLAQDLAILTQQPVTPTLTSIQPGNANLPMGATQPNTQHPQLTAPGPSTPSLPPTSPNSQISHRSHTSHSPDLPKLPILSTLAPLSQSPRLCASASNTPATHQSTLPNTNPKLDLTIPAIRRIPLNPENPFGSLLAHTQVSQALVNQLQTLPTPKPRTYQRINDPEYRDYGPNHPYAQTAAHKFEIPESDWNTDPHPNAHPPP